MIQNSIIKQRYEYHSRAEVVNSSKDMVLSCVLVGLRLVFTDVGRLCLDLLMEMFIRRAPAARLPGQYVCAVHLVDLLE